MKISFTFLVSVVILFWPAYTMTNMLHDSNTELVQKSNDVREVLVVRGVVGRDSGSFFPFYRIPANDRNLEMACRLPREGSHSVVFLDAKGRALLEIAWTPKFPQGKPEQKPEKAPFTWFVIPPQDVAEVEIQVEGRKVSGFKVGANAPTIEDLKIEIIRDSSDPRAQSAELVWSVSHPSLEAPKKTPGILYQVYYSDDDRASWILVQSGLEEPATTIDLTKLPGGRRCFFRVTATDGYNSGARISRPFSIADKPPSCKLIAPRNGKTYRADAGVLLIGSCVDLEDGSLTDRNHVWHSDVQGIIGRGKKLVVRDLIIGVHRIILVGRDSEGNEGFSPTLNIEIISRKTK